MYKSKLFHSYSIIRMLFLIPVLCLNIWIIFIFMEPHLNIAYSGLSINRDFFKEIFLGEPIGAAILAIAYIFILIALPFFIFRSFMTVRISKDSISINRCIVLSQKNIAINSIDGYSISYTSTRTNILGRLNFYSPNGNFRILSSEVNDLSEVHRIIRLTDISFLGYEPQRFNWSWKRFGRRKFMFDNKIFTSFDHEASFYLEWLNSPKIKSLLWYVPILLFWTGLFITAPIADIVTRQNSYDLHHFGETTYGIYSKCVNKVHRKGSLKVKSVKAYYRYTINNREFTGHIKFDGEKCPPQNSKIKLIYNTKNPKVHRTLE